MFMEMRGITEGLAGMAHQIFEQLEFGRQEFDQSSCGYNLLLFAPSIYMLQIYDRVLSSRSADTLLMLTLIVALIGRGRGTA